MLKTIKIFFTYYFLFYNFVSFAQTNLVPNPSFEDTVNCPIGLGNNGDVVSWSSFGNTPDYFNRCHTSINSAGVPYNYYGFQQPHTGNGYYGMIVYSSSGSYREPIGCNLISPLFVGQKYYASACINMAHCSLQGGAASNKLGFKFTKANYSQSNPIAVNNLAHIYTNSINTDTLNWTRIFGSFIADSSYTKVVFGNFFQDQNTNSTDPMGCGTGLAYYYVDDICVSTDSIFVATYATGLNESIKDDLIKVYPNPANESINIKTYLKLIPQVYDLIGNKVNFTYESFPFTLNIKTFDWENGVYFLKIESVIKKIIINH